MSNSAEASAAIVEDVRSIGADANADADCVIANNATNNAEIQMRMSFRYLKTLNKSILRIKQYAGCQANMIQPN